MMKDVNDRLNLQIRPYLKIEGLGRIAACWEQHVFVPTAGTKLAMVAMKACLEAPDSTKPVGLIVTGESDTGKSRMMKEFAKLNARRPSEDNSYDIIPVILLHAPGKMDRFGLVREIISKISPIVPRTKEYDELERYALGLMMTHRVKTVLIDEAGDLTGGAISRKDLETLSALKHLVNKSQRPFVLGGVDNVNFMINHDPQTQSRFPMHVELRPFDKEDFAKAFLSFERVLPLRRRSLLRDNEMIARVYDVTLGYIGRLSRLLMKATELAITSREERITPKLMSEVLTGS